MTTNLNSNTTSQTLFRFATMRNPELSDPQNLDKRFIFRDKAFADGSVFDNNIATDKTLQAVCRRINENQLTPIYSEDELKDIYGSEFYHLAVWVARNKSTIDKERFDVKIEEYKSSGYYLIDDNEKTRHWDNLIYQVVTQKDFYAKELLIQYLHLDHIFDNYDWSEEMYQDIIKAKVVLPKELFKLNQSDAISTGISTSQRALYNNKAMVFTESNLQINENQQLIDVLSKLENTYKKNYNKAYKNAFSDYETEIKPLRRDFEREMNEANRVKEILQNRINYLTKLSVADPEKFYNNSELDMELHRIKDEILQIPMSEIEIPSFEFSYETPEIDPASLERSLSTTEKNTLCRVLGASTVTEALTGIDSFQELNQNIQQNNQALQQTVLNNTVINPQISANIGGVVVPVNTQTNTSGYLPFSIKTYARTPTEWSLMLVLENPVNIISASYKAIINNTQILSTSLVYQGGTSYLLFDSPRIPTSQTYTVEIFFVEGEFISDKGVKYNFNVQLDVDGTDNDRLTKQPHFRGADGCLPVDPPKETPGNPEPPQIPTYNPTESSSFIPSGFGMKNIGVADYLKVEQSTYCYLEGDVAHIENIMAREYKERSTRRLKRSESQTTKSSESEKEKLTDTTTTERHEMQSEISKILQESKDFAAQAGAHANWGVGGSANFGITANASYATHNSKEESNRQAVTEAKEITARALDRIVTKVKEERIDKILEEFEENNKHGFDNTKGSNHVVGVYRWVDKVVKNQIYNYGKRMMFEFMVPEPAKLHTLGLNIIDESEKLVKPVDPRESIQHQMKDFTTLNNDTILKYWSSKYNVEINNKPLSKFSLGKSLGGQYSNNLENIENFALKDEIQIPENYIAVSGSAQYTAASDGAGASVSVLLGDIQFYFKGTWGQMEGRSPEAFLNSYSQSIPISTTFYNQFSGTVNFTINLELTEEAKNVWLQSTFNKIIEAYEIELDKYNQALAEAKALGVQIKGSNPGFYRKIENTILRRNCISYMINQNPNAELTFGKKRYYINNGAVHEDFINTDILVDEKLDQYSAFVKFMEQAFEWDIMSYYFYPYYWGDRNSWSSLYQYDDNDPTFRAFMQSGMARVIVTVRPGFEEAVRHFLATGQIWNGGEVPVIDDPMFLSIVDEMRAAVGQKQGEPWREKIPTSLTILQADSIGLKVEKALPCNCESGEKFNDDFGDMCATNFALNNNQIGQIPNQWIEITFNEMDDINNTTIQNFIDQNLYPKSFECLENVFEINDLHESDPSIKLYKRIADEVSKIEGVEAYPSGENGICFKINSKLIKKFNFRETTPDSLNVNFLFSTDAETYVQVKSPDVGYGITRVLDKNGLPLTPEEYSNKAPLSKFLV